MKKKFSIVLSILIVVCTLAIALVACTPKNPDPFKAPVKVDAYEEIWNAWLKSCDYANGDTLGIDLNIDAKNSKDAKLTNLSIILQVGLDGKSGSEKEALRFAIIDNNANDSIFDVAINRSGLYLDILGLEKPLKFEELTLPALGVGPEGAENVITDFKNNIFDTIVGAIGTDVTIDPELADKKNKLYDVTYTFGFDFTAINSLLSNTDEIIALINMPELKPILEQVLPMVKDLISDMSINFTMKTTGNTQTKIKKPAKGAPKYSYAGGSVSQINVVGSKGSDSLNIAVNGLKLLNTLPTINFPADSAVVKTSLLKHDLIGDIDMMDANGEIMATYSYQLFMDISAKDLINMIVASVNNQNADILLDTLFKSNTARFFFEIYHECGTTCQIGHAGKYKSKGSILSIAYSNDEKEFNNNRINVAFHLRGLIPAKLLSNLNADAASSVLSGSFIQLSIDPFTTGESLINSIIELISKITNPTVASAIGAVSDSSANNNILSVITGMFGKTDENGITIETKDILVLIDSIDMDVATKDTLKNVVDGLLPNVAKLSINANYVNGSSTEFKDIDILQKYIRLGETINSETGEIKYTNKSFGSYNTAVVVGTPKVSTDKTGNVEFFYNKELHKMFYDNTGKTLSVSYDEVMGLVDKNSKGTNGQIKVSYIEGTNKQEVYSFLNIIGVEGLDKSKIGIPQKVKLIANAGTECKADLKNGIGGGLGNSINNLLNLVKTAVSTNIIAGLESLTPILDFYIPELMVETTITLAETKSIVWSQRNVAGITEDLIGDEKPDDFIFVREKDKISKQCNLTIEYDNGYKKSLDITSDVIKEVVNNDNVIMAWSTFNLDFNAFNIYTHRIVVKMDDSLAQASEANKVTLTMDENGIAKWTQTFKMTDADGTEFSFVPLTGYPFVEEFANKYGFECGKGSGILPKDFWINFDKTGIYTITFATNDYHRINWEITILPYSTEA